MMSGFIKTEAALLPVDILRQAGINFAFRFRREDIKQVIFNNPATVVFWSDGTKTVVKCSENDEFSPETGLAMAVCKKAFGNTGAYNEVFKKWISGTGGQDHAVSVDEMRRKLVEYCSPCNCSNCTLGHTSCRCGGGAYFDIPKDRSGYMTDDEIREAYNLVFGK